MPIGIPSRPHGGRRPLSETGTADPGNRAPRDDAIAPDPERGAGPPLVGRTPLLRALEIQLKLARSGHGRLVLLSGEAGVGKTRLALELASRARSAGLEVHTGHALEEPGAPAYRPWIEILRSVLAGDDAEAIDSALAGAPAAALDTLLRSDAPPPSTEGPGEDGGGFLLLDAACRALVGAARRRPRLLVLEDLHQADPASLRLLRMLVGELGEAPLLVLGTHRDEGRAPSLSDLPAAATRIAVPGLDPPEVGRLVRETAGDAAKRGLVEAITLRTGGNPLFVQEVTRALVASGGFWAADASEQAARCAPSGVRQVIGDRIAGLATEVREVLERASVIGRRFDSALVERAWPELDRDRLAAGLRAAEAATLVAAQETSGDFAFVHDLFRQCLYESIPADRRAELHGRIGDALERRGSAGHDGRVEALAHHFGEAAASGKSDPAIRWSLLAARHAIEVAAYEDATSHALRALRTTATGPGEPEPSAVRAELLVLLGRARWLAGAPAEARQAHRSALAEAEATDSRETYARAALGFIGPTDATPGVNQEGVAFLERALARLPEADHPLRAEILARLGTELYYGPDPEEPQRLANASVEMAERLGDETLLAYALSARGYIALRPEVPIERRLRLADRVVALAERNGAEGVRAIGLQERLLAQLELAEGQGITKTVDAYGAIAQRLGQPFLHWMHGLYRGTQDLLAGRIERAEQRAHDSFARGQRLGTPNALGAFSAQLYGIRSEQGRLGELDAPLATLAREQPELPVFRVGAITVAAHTGRSEEARGGLTELVDVDLERLPRDQNWLPVMALMADACATLDEVRLARRLRAALEPHARQVVVAGHGAAVLGAVAHHLGRLTAVLGEVERASEWFVAAAALHARLHSPLWVAHSQREHAAALLRAGVEREQARTLAQRAHEAYEGFGIRHRQHQARALLESSGGEGTRGGTA